MIASSRRALPLVKRMFGAALGIEGVDRHQLRHTVRVAWLIRTAASEDRDAILSVVRDAFSDDDRDAHEEVVIVRDTWSADASPEGCELVAVDDDAVVGHVLGARGNLGGREVLAVAPLGVASSRQGQGIGTALMTELLRRAEAAGRWPLVVLLGNPLYYERFGFEPSGSLAIVYPPVGPDNVHFLVRRLSGYDASYRGDFAYCWEKDDTTEDT